MSLELVYATSNQHGQGSTLACLPTCTAPDLEGPLWKQQCGFEWPGSGEWLRSGEVKIQNVKIRFLCLSSSSLKGKIN